MVYMIQKSQKTYTVIFQFVPFPFLIHYPCDVLFRGQVFQRNCWELLHLYKLNNGFLIHIFSVLSKLPFHCSWCWKFLSPLFLVCLLVVWLCFSLICMHPHWVGVKISNMKTQQKYSFIYSMYVVPCLTFYFRQVQLITKHCLPITIFNFTTTFQHV